MFCRVARIMWGRCWGYIFFERGDGLGVVFFVLVFLVEFYRV